MIKLEIHIPCFQNKSRKPLFEWGSRANIKLIYFKDDDYSYEIGDNETEITQNEPPGVHTVSVDDFA